MRPSEVQKADIRQLLYEDTRRQTEDGSLLHYVVEADVGTDAWVEAQAAIVSYALTRVRLLLLPDERGAS